jgi:hypothetical protein
MSATDFSSISAPPLVIPAKAGIQCRCVGQDKKPLGPRLRGDDVQ